MDGDYLTLNASGWKAYYVFCALSTINSRKDNTKHILTFEGRIIQIISYTSFENYL